MILSTVKMWHPPPPPPSLCGVARNLLVIVIYFPCGSVLPFEKEQLDGSFCKFIVDEVMSQ